MRCLMSLAVLVLGLLAVNLQQAQAQPAGSTGAAGAARSGSATQPAAREPGTMQNQDNAKSKPAAGSQPASQPTSGNPRVVMQTSQGQIVIELNAEKAPITVANFLQYVDEGFYNGTVFHRVIADFMIQGGGFGTDSKEKKTRGTIKNEGRNGLRNVRGSIAMARKPNPDSATAQFFINVKDNAALDYPSNGGYAVFGKVVEGMDVVDKIRNVPTGTAPFVTEYGPQPFQDAPKTPVVIESVKRQ